MKKKTWVLKVYPGMEEEYRAEKARELRRRRHQARENAGEEKPSFDGWVPEEWRGLL